MLGVEIKGKVIRVEGRYHHGLYLSKGLPRRRKDVGLLL